MTTVNSRFAAWLGTAAVVLHGAPLVLHGVAHVELAIYLESVLANVYIFVVLYAAPVIAAALLWFGWTRSGAWLLFWAMLGSIAFEGYNHFLVMSPDHVSQVPEGTWGTIFRVTAVLSLITEFLGCAAGLWIIALARRPLAVPLTDSHPSK
jgi:hypothetical protein